MVLRAWLPVDFLLSSGSPKIIIFFDLCSLSEISVRMLLMTVGEELFPDFKEDNFCVGAEVVNLMLLIQWVNRNFGT